MALTFSYHGKEDTKKWTKEDWQLYNSLVWGTMAAGISFLCEESADEFVRRLNAIRFFKELITKDQIVKFYGLSTNADFLTAREWAIRHFAHKYHEGKTYNSTWVRKVQSASNQAYKEYPTLKTDDTKTE